MKSKDLPNPPSLKKILGPSFILLGLALGSGELILWPYLTSQYGLGLLWGALLGISFQFLLNTEVMRYTLAWGESVFVGFWKISKALPWWFIFSTFIPWSLPGFSSGVAEIIGTLLGVENTLLLAIGLLLLVGLILTLGKTLYKTMEVFQKTIILLGLPFILLLVFLFAKPLDLLTLGKGLIGGGNGWWFFPPGLIWASFLGAVAYSGAGGNLNLAQSYYIKEKGLGMGKFGSKISSLFKGGSKEVKLSGEIFADSKENRAKFRKWWRLINKEHFLVFWVLGFLTIIALALLSYILTFGQAQAQGIGFIFQESEAIGLVLGGVTKVVFLVMAAGMLYSTQLGVLESSSRIISENILLLNYQEGKKVNASLYFYLSLWAQITLGIIVLLLGWSEPRFLLTLGAILNALAMSVSFPLIWYLNKKKLPNFAQAKASKQIFYWLGFVFLALFSLVVLITV